MNQKTNSAKQQLTSNTTSISIIVTAVVLMAMVMLINSCNKKTEAKKFEASERARTNPPATVVVVQKVGMQPTLYKFTDNKPCITVQLGYHARWYPKEGSVRVTRPDKSEYIDVPGVDAPLTKFGPGEWKFCREDVDAIGIEIWE